MTTNIIKKLHKRVFYQWVMNACILLKK